MLSFRLGLASLRQRRRGGCRAVFTPADPALLAAL
jgi:hypothetical protein